MTSNVFKRTATVAVTVFIIGVGLAMLFAFGNPLLAAVQ